MERNNKTKKRIKIIAGVALACLVVSCVVFPITLIYGLMFCSDICDCFLNGKNFISYLGELLASKNAAGVILFWLTFPCNIMTLICCIACDGDYGKFINNIMK